MAIALTQRTLSSPDDENRIERVHYSAAVSEKIRNARFGSCSEAVQQTPKEATEASLDADAKLARQVMPRWVPKPTPPSLSLEPLQEWEGFVTEITSDTFKARLVDLTAGKTIEEEIAQFSISELSADNKAVLREGAVFRWIIGYQRSDSGTKRRVSDIVFRRLPAWTKQEIEAAHKYAAKLREDILWE